MARYIDSEPYLNCRIVANKEDEGIPVSDIPETPLEPVKHGKWEMTEDGAAYCTAHKGKLNPYCYGYQRCPRCGARMDGDTKYERSDRNE